MVKIRVIEEIIIINAKNVRLNNKMLLEFTLRKLLKNEKKFNISSTPLLSLLSKMPRNGIILAIEITSKIALWIDSKISNKHLLLLLFVRYFRNFNKVKIE